MKGLIKLILTMVGVTIGIYLVFGTIYTILVYTSSEGYLREKYTEDLLATEEESIKTDCYNLEWETIARALDEIGFLSDVNYFHDICDIWYRENKSEATVHIHYLTSKQDKQGYIVYDMKCEMRDNSLELKSVEKTNTKIEYSGEVPDIVDEYSISEAFKIVRGRVDKLSGDDIWVRMHVGELGYDTIEIFRKMDGEGVDDCIEKYMIDNGEWVKVDS